jgi:hypothetical protein
MLQKLSSLLSFRPFLDMDNMWLNRSENIFLSLQCDIFDSILFATLVFVSEVN